MRQDDTELEYAGFWVRVGASLIDAILTALITLPLLSAVYGARYWSSESFLMGPADFFISYVLPAALVILFWLKLGATPGKMAIRATVVDARTGDRPGLGQCLIRYVGYIVSALPLGLGCIWVGIDARKQGWHDKMAGTVVVRRRADGQVRFEQPRTGS